MLSPKPTIFISSTIYDFRDLRSALKYWLEEVGYEVMLSEFNDFNKPLNENSYNACLSSIQKSDYFILLLGTRIGGLYDIPGKISITRKEYETAYELVKSKKIKLITFVRQDLWTIKEDRTALAKYLKENFSQQKELTEDEIQKITKHSSNFINDAELAFDFLKEVSRQSEMKAAMYGKGEFPVGNWIHPFNSFQDIVDTLNTVLRLKTNLSTIALLANLKAELLKNLSGFVVKDNIYKKLYYRTEFNRELQKLYQENTEDKIKVKNKTLTSLATSFYIGNAVYNLSSQFIDQALEVGIFLKYNSDLRSYETSLIHQSLFNLKENIVRVKHYLESDSKRHITSFIKKYDPKYNLNLNPEEEVEINYVELLQPMAAYNSIQNIELLCSALLKSLNGSEDSLLNLKLNHYIPSQKVAKEWESIQPTSEEILQWLEIS